MRGWLLSALGMAVLAGCEPVTTPPSVASLTAGLPPFLQADPRLSVAHVGTRRLEFPQTGGLAGAYRERITTDGLGRFALEPLPDHAAPLDGWDEFELRQRARQGFLFRYRDFHVRDAQLFAQNWVITPLQRNESVAGRPCDAYRLVRSTGEPSAIELSIDQETGLVLASREFDAHGRLVAEMAYESLRLDPDLGSAAWHQASNVERVFPSIDAIEEELQVRTLRPRLLPDGYAALEIATVTDGAGNAWLKLTYTDGVEPLFFLQSLTDAQAVQPLQDGVGVEKLPGPSSVMVFELGTATAIQGTVEGYRLIVVGSVPEAELLDLIESSLP